MESQERVAEFVQEHEIEARPEFRLLDLVSELGEVAKDATTSTDYGASPDELAVNADEIGDVLFALFALADSLDIDANEALDTALAKYEDRLSEEGTAGSGE